LMRSDDLYMIHGLVAEGLGCALTTEAAVDMGFDVAIRPAKQDLGRRRVSFVTRAGPVPTAVGWFREILETVAAERGAASAAEGRDANLRGRTGSSAPRRWPWPHGAGVRRGVRPGLR